MCPDFLFIMANFTVKSSCQARHCERLHHKQYLKAIFSFPAEREAQYLLPAEVQQSRAGKDRKVSLAFDFTQTLTHTHAPRL